jgi:ABC-type sugar transport system ATPase subunit
MADVKLRGVRKSFGSVEVLHGIDLDIAAGEFVVFVGPSGCGKSTLLRLIAGLEEISSGTIEIGGEEANRVPPADRGIAMVFQSYALYPHMSVYDNMAFGLKLSKTPKAEVDARVRKAADMLQLGPYLDRLPRQLSGGQRQRVAIGRAITRDPRVFLFDEPLSNLDAALRVATRVEIANLKQALPQTTMVYVTHDQVEALTLADRIVVLSDGNIEQVGSPMELYDSPENIFVARFIGSPAMNVVPVRLVSSQKGGSTLEMAGGRRVTLPVPAFATQGDHHLGIRPEHIKEVPEAEATFVGKVVTVERLGELAIVHVDIGSGEPLVAKLDNDTPIVRGGAVALGFDVRRAHLFGPDGTAVRSAGASKATA